MYFFTDIGSRNRNRRDLRALQGPRPVLTSIYSFKMQRVGFKTSTAKFF